MLIKDLKKTPKFKAGDGSVFSELLHPDKDNIEVNYSLGQAVVKPKQVSLPHKLSSSEVYYILEGEGEMHIDQEVKNVQTGQAVYIPAGAKQYIKNIGDSDLIFLCLVDPAWRSEDEEILNE